ncbi:hypothetical protein [Cloacibacterium sp.]|uniref:hypothetical protein n=1 Tax=Cloacibacterium sp. TaxID=1913682 RepID=UPI0039E430BF
MNRKKNNIFILIFIFLAVFFTTATNTSIAILINFSFFSLLILTLFVISIIDAIKKTKLKIFFLKIIGISTFSLLIGIVAINLQKEFNKKRVENLIVKIDDYKNKTSKYPEKKQVKFPKIINGLYISEIQYEHNTVFGNAYKIRYYDDFWQYKVYRSDTKKWYIDD